MKGLPDEKDIEDTTKSVAENADVGTYLRNAKAADPKKGEREKEDQSIKRKDRKKKAKSPYKKKKERLKRYQKEKRDVKNNPKKKTHRSKKETPKS